MVEDENCGRWFANGNAEDLAAWISELKQEPAVARRLGQEARALLQRSATPELVTDMYLKLIAQHLPQSARALNPLVRSSDPGNLS